MNLRLISHPNDVGLINNLAFATALKGDLIGAQKVIDKVYSTSGVESYYIKATRSLIHFRSGDTQKGRELYQEAIQDFSTEVDKYYAKLAILNYVREEILAGDNVEELSVFIDNLDRIKAETNQPDILFLKNQVISLFNRKFKSGDFIENYNISSYFKK